MGLTLREGSREYFYRQLDRLFPGLKERYIAAFGTRYACDSPNSASLLRLFHTFCADRGMMHDNDEIFSYLAAFERKTDAPQLSLFD